MVNCRKGDINGNSKNVKRYSVNNKPNAGKPYTQIAWKLVPLGMKIEVFT